MWSCYDVTISCAGVLRTLPAVPGARIVAPVASVAVSRPQAGRPLAPASQLPQHAGALQASRGFAASVLQPRKYRGSVATYATSSNGGGVGGGRKITQNEFTDKAWQVRQSKQSLRQQRRLFAAIYHVLSFALSHVAWHASGGPSLPNAHVPFGCSPMLRLLWLHLRWPRSTRSRS